MKNDTITIVVATHKKYQMPSDKMYLPIHVGAEGKRDENGNEIDLGFQKDNTGDNISLKNSSYCELTALYWAWKNIDSDYIGLAHYRRHFANGKKSDDKFDSILQYEDIEPQLGKYKVFVPKKRKYYIETLYSHYAHTHYAEHLDETRKIVSEIYPEYLNSYDKVLNQTCAYMFNMMILSKELFDDYCEWLFSILFELEKRIDCKYSDLSSFQGRFYGRVSEIIFNVWLDYKINNKEILNSQIKELPYVYTEKINWNRKIISFVRAKFTHKKYEGSF